MEMKIKRIKIQKGISPIVATVILVLIAVILGAVLASFTTGLFQAVTGQESLDVSLLKVKKVKSQGQEGAWVITLQFANTGQTDITITDISITNGTHTYSFTAFNTTTSVSNAEITLGVGESNVSKLLVDSNILASGGIYPGSLASAGINYNVTVAGAFLAGKTWTIEVKTGSGTIWSIDVRLR